MITFVFILTLAGCSADTSESSTFEIYTDFAGTRIGVVTGTICDVVTENDIGATPVYYTEIGPAVEDVRLGRIDGFMVDLSILEVIAGQIGGLKVVEIPREIFSGPMGAISSNQNIIDRFNIFLAGLEASGQLAEIQYYWLKDNPGSDPPMPDIPLSGENGVLTVATSGIGIPFTYFGENNELKGFSIELARRFAAHEGMDIEFTAMDFQAILSHAINGRVDLGIDAITITEERKKSVLFTEPIYYDQLGIITNAYSEFAGKNIAVLTGGLTYYTTQAIGATPIEYNDTASAAEDVRLGRVDGFLHALTAVQVMASQMDGFKAVPVPMEIFSADVAGISHDINVIDRFNSFLKSIEADGTHAEMKARWFSDKLDLDKPIPPIENSGENGILRVATSSDSVPYAFIGPGREFSGFSIELALRFGAYEGKVVEFIDMEFKGLIPYIMSEKAELSLANMAITEERKQSVMFTNPFFAEQHGILIRLDSIQLKRNTDWLRTAVERNLLTDNRYQLIIDGLGITLIIALFAQIFGTVYGSFICYILLRKNKIIRTIGELYCGLIFGIPMVTILFITYYIIFGNTTVSGIIIAIIAFTLVEGASVAQILKGAIGTVDPVEIEAARSIGFSAFRAFLTVTLPQAVRRALPAYTVGFVGLVKYTAIVGFIAVQDLTRAGDIIRSRTFDAYFPLLFTALIYLMVTTILVQLFKMIVRKVQ